MPEKREYQGVRIRVIAQIIDNNVVLFASLVFFPLCSVWHIDKAYS